MKKLTIAFLLALSFSGAYAQSPVMSTAKEVTADLAPKREALKQEIIAKYLALKQSLVVSDSLQAAKYAGEFSTAMTQFKFKKLGLEEMNTATAMRGKLKELALNIARTHSINKQRNYFVELSEGMWTIIARFVPDNTALYEQKCPMTGKVWISDVKEIKNPYFPKNMLTCGEVTATVGIAR